MRVLIVEDHEELASTIATGLRREGVAVDIALDGEAALQRGLVNSYDVVVPGHASYPPAHILTSTQVFKPVAFGGFTTTVIGPDGSVIATETTEAITQGGGNVVAHNPKSYLECTVTFGLVTPEGLTISVTGTVTGFFTSRD